MVTNLPYIIILSFITNQKKKHSKNTFLPFRGFRTNQKKTEQKNICSPVEVYFPFFRTVVTVLQFKYI